MQKLTSNIMTGCLTFGFGVAMTLLVAVEPKTSTTDLTPSPVPTPVVPLRQDLPNETHREQRPADYFLYEVEFRYSGYTIQRRSRKARLNYPEEAQDTAQRVDVSYVAIEKSRKLRREFDADVYFGMGNSADAGLFPFLGGATQQLFISQDVPRGGCQWIVSLTPQFRVIFDGQEFGVGREATDLSGVDLDHDGVYEIIVPITDFYDFQDKMSISEIPLPDIVFKYDPQQQKYLPANPMFPAYLVKQTSSLNETDISNELHYRSIALHEILPLIYAGERERAWHDFHSFYKLKDKAKIEHRVKSILERQPVYNFIYAQH